MIYRSAKTMKWIMDGIFNKQCLENLISTWKRMRVDPYLTSYIKIKSKLIKDLIISPETIKIPEEYIRRYLHDIRMGIYSWI